jgi:hypothetical protein
MRKENPDRNTSIRASSGGAMTIMGKELSTTIAVEEAHRFYKKLLWETIGGQLIMLVTLGLMAYYDVSVAWLVAIGLFLATGTITGILLECALRFDAGRAYLEIWTSDAREYLIRIDEKVR